MSCQDEKSVPYSRNRRFTKGQVDCLQFSDIHIVDLVTALSSLSMDVPRHSQFIVPSSFLLNGTGRDLIERYRLHHREKAEGTVYAAWPLQAALKDVPLLEAG